MINEEEIITRISTYSLSIRSNCLQVLSQGDLFYLALAANYMDVKMLLKYIVVTIANAIRVS